MTPADWLRASAIILGTIGLGLVARYFIFRAVRRTFGTNVTVVTVYRAVSGPATMMLQLLAVLLVIRYLGLPEPFDGLMGFVRHVASLGFIGMVAWLAIALMLAGEQIVSARFPTDVENNLEARRIWTRVAVFRRVGVAIVAVITVSAMLMTFPTVQHLGTSLLASAGVIGVIAGVAAQRTIGNLIAGLQIAMSQPIRLDDVVVIDGEWGWIDEIGTTHVSVRLWDLRHLVVPLSYVIERPFQNWTRHSSNLLGTAMIYMDYSVPVEEVRAELHRVLQQTSLWDGRTWGLQVTNTTPHALELRALMSARDGSTLWDLRCHVRERMIAFLQEHYPESLPKTRMALVPGGDDGSNGTEPGTQAETGIGDERPRTDHPLTAARHSQR